MSNNFHPTEVKNRIELLDVLRGFAIAGVLLVNILYFSGYIYTPFEDMAKMSFPQLNKTLIAIIFPVLLGKFYPILGMLFGAGLFMQFKKKQNPGFMKFFIKRMSLLLLIGALHELIWPGDVVMVYALFAFLMIPLRNFKPKQYLVFAVIMLILNFVALYLTDLFVPAKPILERTAHMHLSDFSPNELVTMIQNDGFNGFITLIKTHLGVVWTIERYGSLSFRILLIFASGAYLFGSGFLMEKAHKLKYFFIFLVIGLLGSYLMYYVSWYFKIIDNLFLALTYISLVAVLMKTKLGYKMLKGLAPLGRMALTNYIFQSVLGIIIFYGIGFGFFGKLPLYQIQVIGIVMLITQIQFSKFWLKKYNFGPLEWLWRRLSYGKQLNNMKK